MTSPGGSSAYRIAIDHTIAAIEKRARRFRNVVVSTVAITFGSVAVAVCLGRVWPLAGLLSIVPVCGAFWWLDDRILSAWRVDLMTAWVRRGIEFCALRDSMTAISMLPQDTTRSMLATLPLAAKLTDELEISSSTREGIATAMEVLHASRSDLTGLRVAATTIAAGSIIASAGLMSPGPLVGVVLAILLPSVGPALELRRSRVLDARVLNLRERPDFCQHQYDEMLVRLSPPSPIRGYCDGSLLPAPTVFAPPPDTISNNLP